MTITALKLEFEQVLAELYPKTEIHSFFHILTEFQLQLKRIDIALNPNFGISTEDLSFFKNALESLKSEKPIQYITGEAHFYGMRFKVNQHTLIPRPETEELIDWIIASIPKKKTVKILDIGTGSGCIAISLAKNIPNAVVTAIDISSGALKTAQENAVANNAIVNFTTQDILQAKTLPDSYDIIVSNPPYVRELEKASIKNNVLLHEPHTALFVPDDNALIFYRKIAKLASEHLTFDGKLFFEINEHLATETLEMLKNSGFAKNQLKKDIFERNRMTCSSK